MCKEAVAGGYPPFEALVFPNEAHTFFEVNLIDMRLVRKDRDDRIRGDYEASRPILGEAIAQAYKNDAEAFPLYAAFTLIGCAVYSIPVGQSAWQTAFIYDINHACGMGPFGICTFDMTKPALYAKEAVVGREPVGGTFAR